MKQYKYVLIPFIIAIGAFAFLNFSSEKHNVKYNENNISNPVTASDSQKDEEKTPLPTPTPAPTMNPIINGKSFITPEIVRDKTYNLTINLNDNWEFGTYGFPYSPEYGSKVYSYFININNVDNPEYKINYWINDTGFGDCKFDLKDVRPDSWDVYYELVSEFTNDIGPIRIGKDPDENVLIACEYGRRGDRWINITTVGLLTIRYPEDYNQETLIEAIDIIRNTKVKYYD